MVAQHWHNHRGCRDRYELLLGTDSPQWSENEQWWSSKWSWWGVCCLCISLCCHFPYGLARYPRWMQTPPPLGDVWRGSLCSAFWVRKIKQEKSECAAWSSWKHWQSTASRTALKTQRQQKHFRAAAALMYQQKPIPFSFFHIFLNTKYKLKEKTFKIT